MFTGIIQTTSPIIKSESHEGSLFLTIEKPGDGALALGDSVSVDGACLTIAATGQSQFSVELMPETLAKTSFGHRIPKQVNLERPLKLTDFLDGHLVQGHVDATGHIKAVRPSGQSKLFTISFPEQYSSHLVGKGSIAVDGISLTVTETDNNWFRVALVSHTLSHTTIGSKQPSDPVNLEFDIIAKYVAKLMNKS